MTPLTVAQDALCMGLVVFFCGVVARSIVEACVAVWKGLKS